jgi:toxin YoeB
MNVLFTEHGWEDYLFWQQTDRKMLSKINDLIRDIQRSTTNGIGKPEYLKGDLVGRMSRRINLEHRLVYKIDQGAMVIAQCRYHH